MTEQTADTLTQKTPTEFRGSIVRTIVISLLIIALLPALIFEITSYFQFSNSIKTQTISQISSLAQSYSFEIEQLNSITQSSIISLSNSSTVAANIDEYSKNSYYFFNNSVISDLLQSTIDNMSDNGVFAIYAVQSDGRVIFASKKAQIGTTLTKNKAILSLIGTSKSAMVFDPDNNYPNQLVITSAYTKKFEGLSSPITFIYYSKPNLLTTILKNPLSYFISAHVYFLTSDGKSVSLNSVMQTPELTKISDDQLATINKMAASSVNGQDYTYENYSATNVYAYMRPISQVNGTYVIEVPVNSVQGQLQSLIRYSLIILAAVLAISGIIAFIGARSLAVPLVELSDKAKKFANGDFTQKAVVNRRDEVGMLASSFNYMVSQLSTFYSSLEAKVADRTEQLRTVSDIAMDAVSAPTTSGILNRMVSSIVEKLDYSYASVFLVGKNNKDLVLTADHSKNDEPLPDRAIRLPVGNTSLIGWVAANRQPRLSQNIQSETPKLLETPHLQSTQSEIALPITIGDRLIGVLNIQSEIPGTFDPESLPAFTTLTTQVSTGLRNIELLESTQMNLQETAALYSSTRAISQASQEEEVIQEINTLFTQSPYVSFFLNVAEDKAQLVNIADASSTSSDLSLIGSTLPFVNALHSLAENGLEIIDNFQLVSNFSQLTSFLGRRGCHSAAMIPVYEGTQLKHVLAIGSRDDQPLTNIQMQPYANLAETIGSSLDKIHLNKSLSNKERDISMLSNVYAETRKEIELPEIYRAVHDQVRSAYGQTVGFCIFLLDINSGNIEIPYCFGSEYQTIAPYPLGDDLVSQIIKTGKSNVLEDASLNSQLMINSPVFSLPVKSFIGVPMFKGNKCFGGITVFLLDKPAEFSQENKVAFDQLASQLALTIDLDRQNKNLKEIQSNFEYEKYLLNTLMENIPDRISFKDEKNKFIRLSLSMAKFLGRTGPTELIGSLDDFNYSSEDASNNSAPVDVISTQTPLLNQKEKWVDREGNTQWVVSNKIPLVSPEGSVTGLLSISNDITDLVKVQELAEHRADQLLTASEIAQESTTGTMDVEVTLARLVDLIKSRFDFYHASIFLIDPLGKFAVLRESTGDAGAQLKQAGHKLAVGSSSIVGQATGKGIPVVVGDVTQEANYYPNPLLPLTRSEMAIPMRIGDRILGAVDVQSTAFNAFTQDDINILQILANQTAVAVQNEDLFTHTTQSLSRHRLLHKITSSNVENMTVEDAIRATLEVLHQSMPEEQITYFTIGEHNDLIARANAGITNPDQTSRRIPFGQGVVGRVASDGTSIRVNDTQTNKEYHPQNFESNSILAVPVKFADTLVGVLNIESIHLAQFDESDQEFVTTLAGNMAAIISNIQLVDQVREQVNRQQKLLEITSKIRRSVDINTIMQTSVSEIGSAMNVRRASITISPNFESQTKKEEKR
jgi:PAS domain S-box-containing protein